MVIWIRAAAGAIALAGLISCSTMKITAGWDKNVDFSKYYTWAWKDDRSIRDPVWSKRFQDVLADELEVIAVGVQRRNAARGAADTVERVIVVEADGGNAVGSQELHAAVGQRGLAGA